MSDSVFGDLDGLLKHVDSKFSLVNVVTKRAKQLNNGAAAADRPGQPEQARLDGVQRSARRARFRYKRTREGIK